MELSGSASRSLVRYLRARLNASRISEDPVNHGELVSQVFNWTRGYRIFVDLLQGG